MNDSIFRISLDIHEHGSQAVLKAKYADTGRKLCISLRSGGTPYIIADGCYAAFKATKPDGKILYNACTIEDNEIIYEFTEQTCTAIGRSRCEIALYGSDDKLITSPRFALLVDGTIYPDNVVESTDEFSALTDLVGTTQKFIEDATEATDRANAATVRANVATANATDATNTANEAAASATQSAQFAITATTNANKATGAANIAAATANDAAGNANQAAENANEATTQVVRIAKNTMAAGEVSGESVTMDDAVEFGFIGFRIFGKTTQNGTPTPDAPVDLVNIGNSGSITVSVAGDNDTQSMTIATPNGLPGIPVESGGNYTDANGQQWICDEIDFARGVLIKRATTMTLVGDTSENIRFQAVNAHGIANFYISIESLPAKSFNLAKSNRLPLQQDLIADATTEGLLLAAPNGIYLRIASDRASDENPLKMVLQQWNAEGNALQICYALATPIETPLSAEEIAAYSALHTYRDNTTVSNDAGAWMELEYLMDAKKYIDSKIAGSILTATVE